MALYSYPTGISVSSDDASTFAVEYQTACTEMESQNYLCILSAADVHLRSLKFVPVRLNIFNKCVTDVSIIKFNFLAEPK